MLLIDLLDNEEYSIKHTLHNTTIYYSDFYGDLSTSVESAALIAKVLEEDFKGIRASVFLQNLQEDEG